MWDIEGDLDGRVTVTRCRNGDARQIYQLRLTGRDVYQMQRLLEETAVSRENYLAVREAVLLAENLREAVKQAREQGPSPGGTRGG